MVQLRLFHTLDRLVVTIQVLVVLETHHLLVLTLEHQVLDNNTKIKRIYCSVFKKL